MGRFWNLKLWNTRSLSWLVEDYSCCVCVCVSANKEYYHQWSVEECHGCSLDLSAFTIEELDNITSEYTLKNTVSPCSFSFSVEHRVLDPALRFCSVSAIRSPSFSRWLPALSLRAPGHVLDGGVVPVGEGRVRIPPVFHPAALQARVPPGDHVFRASRSAGRQHLLQQHDALPPASLGLLHWLRSAHTTWSEDLEKDDGSGS